MFDRQNQSVEALAGVTRDDFSGHFETLFFSESTARMDIQVVTETHAGAYQAAWSNNEKGEMSKILKRSKFEGSIEEFKNNSVYHADGVIEAFKRNSA